MMGVEHVTFPGMYFFLSLADILMGGEHVRPRHAVRIILMLITY